MIIRTYEPKGYSAKITFEATTEQVNALDKLAEKKEFNAFFWAEKVVWLNNGNKTEDGQKVARIDGRHYVIGSEDDTGFRGFSGHEFKIKLNNGEEIITKNLWHQGSIPEELKEILIDNAEFIK